MRPFPRVLALGATIAPLGRSGESKTASDDCSDAPGTYEYDCSVHASQMTGRVVVQ